METVPLVIPKHCPGCKDPRRGTRCFNSFGAVYDVLLEDSKFNLGKGGFVRLIGWIACDNSLMGTVIDSFDAEGNSNWVKYPRPFSTEHVYLPKLHGRRICNCKLFEGDISIMTLDEFKAQYEDLRRFSTKI